jgi:tetratricopeptide (TPR) repeat protein
MNAFPGDERLISELKKMEADLNNQRYLPKRQGPMLIEEIPYMDNADPSSSNVKALEEAEHFHGLCREIEIRTHTSQARCVEEPLTAEEQRVRGNKLFSNGLYEAAIDLYSKSIELDSSVAATYTNRALCYLKVGTCMHMKKVYA